MVNSVKNKELRDDYKKYEKDIQDYSVAVHTKFGLHNAFLFFLYGLGLSVIEIEKQSLVCALCFSLSISSITVYSLSKVYFAKYRKWARIVYNIYLAIFLVLLTVLYFYHPSHIAYTVLICSIITTAMTNMITVDYGSILIGTCIFDMVLYFVCNPTKDPIVICGYILNDFLIIIFSIGLNILYSNMKIQEFKQKRFLQNESYHDPLTKTYNRRYVERYMDLNLEKEESCAMFLIDIDNFKAANDICGHEKGDELLCNISDILKRNFRKSDCVARIGGDEFMILMPHISDKNHVIEKVTRILKEFPIEVKNEDLTETVVISVSIGITFTKPGEPNVYEEMYRKTDQYMYKAKKKGKGIAVIQGLGEDIVVDVTSEVSKN